MNLIKQAYVGGNYILFKKNFLNKFDLHEYSDKNKPCIFYGLGKDCDIDIVKKHNNYRIIIFCGYDILYNKKYLLSLNKLRKVYFISISKFISIILKEHKIPFKEIPIAPTIEFDLTKYKPLKKGNSICIYTGLNTRLEIYGFKIWKKLVARFKDINFIIVVNPIHYNQNKKYSKIKINKDITLTAQSYNSYDELYENVYKKCFLGLRLTKNDGNSATVHELGLLGIKSIHNGYQPCSINYRLYSDIVKAIEYEKTKIGTIDNDMYQKMVDYSKINDNWLDVKYYL